MYVETAISTINSVKPITTSVRISSDSIEKTSRVVENRRASNQFFIKAPVGSVGRHADSGQQLHVLV